MTGTRRVAALRALVARTAEGAFLLRSLAEHNLGRLAARTDEATQRALRDGGASNCPVCQGLPCPGSSPAGCQHSRHQLHFGQRLKNPCFWTSAP